MVDFETSEHSAIRSNYPNSTIHGCLFHLKQAVIRHFKAALPAYGANALLRSDFCSFFGLAFVPVADTETCWRLLKNYLLAAYPFAYSTLVIDYLESTWLYSTCYPREMWNMYESVKNEDPWTNNVSEGGNNAINIAAGVSHPKIVPFIKIIQRFNAEHESDLQQFTTGANPHRRRRTRTVERDDRILAIVTSYDGFNLLGYLRRVGNLYH